MYDRDKFRLDFYEFIVDTNDLEREFVFEYFMLVTVSEVMDSELQKLNTYMDINNIELVGTGYRLSPDFILKVTLTRHNFTYKYKDIPY